MTAELKAMYPDMDEVDPKSIEKYSTKQVKSLIEAIWSRCLKTAVEHKQASIGLLT